ncbi:MAG: tetratricopeptide repeat protein [SAR324 cluster bacterium]|nr:tetratricopeptide repeat protein [SAR324 cluster bacterium]
MAQDERIDIKELREPDEIQKRLFAFVDYAYKHRNLFLIGATMVIGLILGVWGLFEYRHSQQLSQLDHLYDISKNTQNAESQALGAAVLEDYAKEQSGSYLGSVALMRVAQQQAETGQLEKAEKIFRQVLEHRGADAFMKDKARIGLVHVYENLQKWDDAQKMAESLNAETWKELRARTLGRIFWKMGNREQARQQWDEMKNIPEAADDAEMLLMFSKNG